MHRTSELPWVEKYRPHQIEDIVGNVEAVSRLKNIADFGNIPNLLLSGPPGTGKTTSILCLAHALLGPRYNEAVLELNASDDRGIEMVRTKLKMFADKKMNLKTGRHKIIILDEADSMTIGAQQALRRTMEVNSNTTRFALTCNQSSKIIEAIQSRCALVKLTKLKDNEILNRLLNICKAENVVYTDVGLEAIIFTADGDMRQAISNMQATHAGFGVVNQENVFKVCDQPQPFLISKIVKACLDEDVETACEEMEHIFSLGYSTLDVITSLYKIIRDYEPIQETIKLEFIRHIGLTHLRIREGTQSRIQLLGLIAKLCKLKIMTKID
jgi:replication factor C subunit 2/4